MIKRLALFRKWLKRLHGYEGDLLKFQAPYWVPWQLWSKLKRVTLRIDFLTKTVSSIVVKIFIRTAWKRLFWAISMSLIFPLNSFSNCFLSLTSIRSIALQKRFIPSFEWMKALGSANIVSKIFCLSAGIRTLLNEQIYNSSYRRLSFKIFCWRGNWWTFFSTILSAVFSSNSWVVASFISIFMILSIPFLITSLFVAFWAYFSMVWAPSYILLKKSSESYICCSNRLKVLH